jgi:hypothetical protein
MAQHVGDILHRIEPSRRLMSNHIVPYHDISWKDHIFAHIVGGGGGKAGKIVDRRGIWW